MGTSPVGGEPSPVGSSLVGGPSPVGNYSDISEVQQSELSRSDLKEPNGIVYLQNCENIFRVLLKNPLEASTHFEFLDNYILFLSNNNGQILSKFTPQNTIDNLFLFIFDHEISFQKKWGVLEFFKSIVNICTQLESSDIIRFVMLSDENVSSVISYTNLLHKLNNDSNDLYNVINEYFLNKNLTPQPQVVQKDVPNNTNIIILVITLFFLIGILFYFFGTEGDICWYQNFPKKINILE